MRRINQIIEQLQSWDKGIRVIRDALFALIFIWMSASYGYFDSMDRFPDGTHVWRKCDGASMALNYAQDNAPLLEPRMHHLFEGSGKAVGEFPVWYYLVGKTYQVFGFSNEVFRWWWWSLLFLGFYFLFQWFYLKTNSTTVSILSIVFCFSPPILVYYGIEFLPDTVALALSFIGMYAFEKWRVESSKLFLLLGVLGFSLAMLTKVSAGMVLVAMGVAYLFELSKKDWKKQLVQALPWVLPLVITLVWVKYAAWYNAQTNNVYFLLDTVPYWTLTVEQIAAVKQNFMNSWFGELFGYKGSWILLTPLFAVGVFWLKKVRNEAISLTTYGGLTLLFVLLFFERFQHHDSYILCLYAMVPLALMFLYRVYVATNPNKLITLAVLIIATPYVSKNVSGAQKLVESRSATWSHYNNFNEDFYHLDDWLTTQGIKKDSPILSVYDFSPNVTLYFMNRKGLTNLYHHELTDEFVAHAKGIGIKHLLVHGKGLQNPKNAQKYCSDTLASYVNIHLFELN